jgi:hypothetical protein
MQQTMHLHILENPHLQPQTVVVIQPKLRVTRLSVGSLRYATSPQR